MSILPFSSGKRGTMAFAAPVVAGTRETAAALPFLPPPFGTSTSTCVEVYAWIVVPIRYSMPNESLSTLVTGASEFVVQDAFDTTACFDGSYLSSLTPRTIVRSESSAGALMTTRFAPASRCAAAFSLLVKKPVHSSTISTPSSFHGSFDGSFSLYSGIFTPSITRESSPASTGNFALP
ncbi:MAG: hypothetical protein BWY99_02716 [Synergistetes bacterium ADurb.BinA166]|nr:MAG: hypothetical protein BWY99_02716 [Synergistetes bacterium ADurb.BinA166]